MHPRRAALRCCPNEASRCGRNMLRNIVIAALLIAGIAIGGWSFIAPKPGGAPVSDGMSPAEFSRESPLVLPGILTNVYDAFGETQEAAIYDRLAEVATGPALEQLYLERVGAMAGGGLNPDQEIHEVSLLGMSARPQGDRVAITAKWRVLGVVGHSEHMHMRGNAYAADLLMAADGGAWKIVGFTLTDVDRTDAGTLERNADAQYAPRAMRKSSLLIFFNPDKIRRASCSIPLMAATQSVTRSASSPNRSRNRSTKYLFVASPKAT